MYKVSVVTPFHNVELGVFEKAYQSMKSQTIGFENIQWIVIAQAIADDSDLFELILENDFFEFMPDNSEPLLLSQVSPGTTCEVIVTNRAGLYRYRIGIRISLVEHSPHGNAIIRIVE